MKAVLGAETGEGPSLLRDGLFAVLNNRTLFIFGILSCMCAQFPDGPVRGVQAAVCREQGLPPRLHLPPAGQPRQVITAVPIQGHYTNSYKNLLCPQSSTCMQ